MTLKSLRGVVTAVAILSAAAMVAKDYTVSIAKNVTLIYAANTTSKIARIKGFVDENATPKSSITIPETIKHEAGGKTYDLKVTIIGENAFLFAKFTKITLPNTVTTIGEDAFSSAELKTITLPSSLETIGKEAFYDTRLSTISIPPKVKSIGELAFWASSLKSIEFQPGVDITIGEGAFYATKLQRLDIPVRVKKISGNLCRDTETLTSISLPSHITEIPASMCAGCTNLSSVTFQNGITKIGAQAFMDCINLREFWFTPSIQHIEHSAFENTALEYVNLTNTQIAKIEGWAFQNNNGLKGIKLPATLQWMGARAFASCPQLERVDCDAVNPPEIYEDCFDDATYKKASAWVPQPSVDRYRVAQGWKLFDWSSYPAAVTDIVTDQTHGTVEYYDLQGRRLDREPQEGLYIRVADGRARKLCR